MDKFKKRRLLLVAENKMLSNRALKRRKPRPSLEQVDSDTVIGYIRARTVFHSKTTVCHVVTALRGMGEFLVQEGIWLKDPLRWI